MSHKIPYKMSSHIHTSYMTQVTYMSHIYVTYIYVACHVSYTSHISYDMT